MHPSSRSDKPGVVRQEKSSSALTLSSFGGGISLLGGLRKELGRPQPVHKAVALVAHRFETRERRFLQFASEAFYGSGANPVQRLLEHCGCAFGDCEELVQREGLEGALVSLAISGVYFRHDEYKGTVPVRRGSLEFQCSTDDFRNPLARLQVKASSSGSRGAGTPVLIDMAYVKAGGISCAASMAARGGEHWRHSVWEVISAGSRFRLLKYSSFGTGPVRWFTQLHPQDASVNALTRWSDRALRWSGRLQGIRLPPPEYAPLENPLPVVRWLRDVLDCGEIPHLLCYPSAAVRLSEAARSAGVPLDGAQITVGGEPATRNRLRSIRQSGIQVTPRYGSMETGPVGYGCQSPQAVDEVHVQRDMFGLVQVPSLTTLPDDALLITGLHTAMPFLFLNMSMGDAGQLNRRNCGCPMCHFPDPVKLSGIYSFEKLTAGGMTFSADSIIPILEDTLPARFGGGTADYQLVESEKDDGQAELRILVHPRVGKIDEQELIHLFLSSLGASNAVNRITEAYWRQSGMVSVGRTAPIPTRTAKTLHLRSER